MPPPPSDPLSVATPSSAPLAHESPGAGEGWWAGAPPGSQRAPVAPERGTWASRAVWCVLFVVPAAVISLAAWLTPDPFGNGTHMQLGLPPCGFYVMTGLPCPGCGLTTSFSYMVRGDVVGAAMANPFGIMLFLVSAATAVLAFVGMVRAWPVMRTLDRFQADKWAMLLAITSLTVWAVKVVTLLATR